MPPSNVHSFLVLNLWSQQGLDDDDISTLAIKVTEAAKVLAAEAMGAAAGPRDVAL